MESHQGCVHGSRSAVLGVQYQFMENAQKHLMCCKV